MHDSTIQFDMAARHRLLGTSADDWLALAIENILREYPHMPWIVASRPESYRLHRDAHPVFFGSFDWHSCVEMYWVAIRLMRLFPGLSHEADARKTIGSLLTPGNVATERAFFLDPTHGGFERPYGWGWLLRLWHELSLWDDDGRRWHATLAPLADTMMDRFGGWLPKMTYPQRTGMHANTAFGLVLAWDAIEHARPDLLARVRERATTWFGTDVDYPAGYEPSGADFLSAALTEAVLMGHVLEPEAFPAWLEAFLPGIGSAHPAALFTPVIVTDASDGQIAHLHGLNLSRAWAFLWIAGRLAEGDGRRDVLERAAREHAAASLGEVSGSHYMVEHWLSAYATLMLSEGDGG